VQWFRGGLVFESQRLLYHSASGSRTFLGPATKAKTKTTPTFKIRTVLGSSGTCEGGDRAREGGESGEKGCGGEREEREEEQQRRLVARVVPLLWTGKLTEISHYSPVPELFQKVDFCTKIGTS